MKRSRGGDVATENVPIVVVESHSRGCESYHALLRQDVVPFTPVTIIHVDSHPDMMLPTIPFKRYANVEEGDDDDDEDLARWCEEELYAYLDSSTGGIAEWLLPLCYQGHVKRLVWLRARWCDQLSDGETRGVRIGRVGEEGLLKLHGTRESYFVDEGLVIDDASEFVDSRAFDLVVRTAEGSSLGVLGGGETTECWLLDVCLDYFAVVNPFYARFEAAMMKDLPHDAEGTRRAMGVCARWFADVDAGEKEGKLAFLNDVLLKTLTMPSTKDKDAVSTTVTPPPGETLNSLLEALEVVRGRAAVAETLAYFENAGLPHHPELDRGDLEVFEGFLEGLPPPRAVMIARSEGDEYTPSTLVREIEEEVVKAIRRRWPGVEFTMVRCDEERV